jgi:hypothetical protein
VISHFEIWTSTGQKNYYNGSQLTQISKLAAAGTNSEILIIPETIEIIRIPGSRLSLRHHATLDFRSPEVETNTRKKIPVRT